MARTAAQRKREADVAAAAKEAEATEPVTVPEGFEVHSPVDQAVLDEINAVPEAPLELDNAVTRGDPVTVPGDWDGEKHVQREDQRIKIKLGKSANCKAKIFTSRGLAVSGSVVELPRAEAQRYCDREQAIVTTEPVNWIEPVTDAEHGLS